LVQSVRLAPVARVAQLVWAVPSARFAQPAHFLRLAQHVQLERSSQLARSEQPERSARPVRRAPVHDIQLYREWRKRLARHLDLI
jgi:hypothetical protein